jgi:hypothetical protein
MFYVNIEEDSLTKPSAIDAYISPTFERDLSAVRWQALTWSSRDLAPCSHPQPQIKERSGDDKAIKSLALRAALSSYFHAVASRFQVAIDELLHLAHCELRFRGLR